MQNGCALLKPSVEHLETWPDLYINNKTYIALNWDSETAKYEILQFFTEREHLYDIGMQYRPYNSQTSAPCL